ncbi:MAG: glycosyltransferase [Bacteroidia bacterium]|nr:glycosyltransferase [Bacteroidia bacterium]
MSKTAIVIPCYNECARLDKSVFLQFLKERPEYFYVFVNDGSFDDTLKMLRCIEAESMNRTIVIENKNNVGKAESVRRGMQTALASGEFENIGFLDADLSTPLDEFDKLNKYLKTENKKAVFGSRLKRMGASIDRTFIRHVTGRIFATLIGWMIRLPFYDTQCGAKIFRSSILGPIIEEPFITKWLFDVEIIMRFKQLAEEHTLRDSISEYPVSVWKEVGGSKLNWKDVYRIPLDLYRIRIHYSY